MLAIAKLKIGRQSSIIEDVGDRKGASRCGEGTTGRGRSSRSSRSNDREQKLTEIGEIPWIQAVFEMEDANIKENRDSWHCDRRHWSEQ